jgi:hypothetical protein
MLLPRRETIARAMATPTVVATATPAIKEAESFTALDAVRKMIADIICGPAIIVMARGRIVRFMAVAHLVFAFLQHYVVLRATTRHLLAQVPTRLCGRGCREGGAGLSPLL